jgi:hypothetical protein
LDQEVEEARHDLPDPRRVGESDLSDTDRERVARSGRAMMAQGRRASVLGAVGCLVVLAVFLLGPASCGVTRKEDCEVTSCARCINWAGGALPVPPPNKPEILPLTPVTLFVGDSDVLTACFFRDEERPAEAQAITWTSENTAVATVSPATGPRTSVRGVAFGVTRVRAIIAGFPAEATVVVQ